MLAERVAHAGLQAVVFNVAGSSLRSACAAAKLADGVDDPNVCTRACNPDDRMTAMGRYADSQKRPLSDTLSCGF